MPVLPCQAVLVRRVTNTNDLIPLFYFEACEYKGSPRVPAFAGTHASGRAGQHFELFDSILGKVKNVTTHNHSLRVQYVRQYQEFDIY